jgi:hypothetical protein
MYVCGTVYTYIIYSTYHIHDIYTDGILQPNNHVTQPGTGVYRYKSIRKKNLVLVLL